MTIKAPALWHDYLSTACLHDEHGYCQASTGRVGEKTPGVCKFCAAPCRCFCHVPPSPVWLICCGSTPDNGHRVTCPYYHPVRGNTIDGEAATSAG